MQSPVAKTCWSIPVDEEQPRQESPEEPSAREGEDASKEEGCSRHDSADKQQSDCAKDDFTIFPRRKAAQQQTMTMVSKRAAVTAVITCYKSHELSTTKGRAAADIAVVSHGHDHGHGHGILRNNGHGTHGARTC
jgi:hypothetical protein